MNIYGHYRETSTPRVNEYDGLIQQAMYFPPSTIEPQDEDGNHNNSFLRVVQLTIQWGIFGKQTMPTRQ